MIETATVVEYWDHGYLPGSGALPASRVAAVAREMAGRPAGPRAHDVADASTALRSLASHPQIVGIVADLFGHQGELLEATLLRARPASPAAPLLRVHPGWADFGVAPDQMVVAYVHLGLPGDPGGTVELLPHHHRPHDAPTRDAPLDTGPERTDLVKVTVPTLHPGDLLFVHSLTPHRPRPVVGAQPWRPLRLTYVVDPRGRAFERFRAWRG